MLFWRSRIGRVLIPGGVALLACSVAAGSPFSGLTVFGDSLSDQGNTSNRTIGIQPGDGYSNGRFSNGEVYPEYLARDLGLSEPSPSTDGGTNYAYGGAWAGNQGGLVDLVIKDLTNVGSSEQEQVQTYLADAMPRSDELFVVFAGANDLIQGSPSNVSSAVNGVTTALNQLYDAGAREFLVPDLPPLGMVPQERGTSDQEPLNQAAASFNQQLAGELDMLESGQTGSTYYELDTAALFREVFNNPGEFGFTNVTDPAMEQENVDADNYLFWDGLHPTTAGHELLAARAAAAVPEPMSLILLGLGGGLLLSRLSRTSRV